MGQPELVEQLKPESSLTDEQAFSEREQQMTMKFTRWLGLAIMLLASAAQADEWQSLFDGKTLDGWDGDPRIWSVQDGTITGRTTEEVKLDKNTFIIWRGGQLDNFELGAAHAGIGNADHVGHTLAQDLGR